MTSSIQTITFKFTNTKLSLLYNSHQSYLLWPLLSSYYAGIRMTGQVIQTDENKHIVLNCSVVGIHSTNTVLEFRFNDNKSYSCRRKRWPNEPEDNQNKPRAHLLDDNFTCQLLIPNPAEMHLAEYYCRAELWIWQEETQSSCFLLSESVTLTDSEGIHKNKPLTMIITITIPAAIILTLLLLIVAVVATRKMKKSCCCRQQEVMPQMIGTVRVFFSRNSLRRVEDYRKAHCM